MSKKQLFENFLMQNIDSAYRFAYTYAKNREDAEDIVSESVVRAIKSIHSLKNPQYIKSWFYRIIINTSLTHIKEKSRIVYLDNEVLARTGGKEDDYSESTIHSLINKLDHKYRNIVVLRFLENMTLGEISKILDVNENTIKTRLYHALELLKIDLEGESHETI